MWPISSALARSLTKSWSVRSRRHPPPTESDVQPPTKLAEAQEALQRAQKDRARVIGMRPQTEENVRKAKRLLAEDYLARRIRESYR